MIYPITYSQWHAWEVYWRREDVGEEEECKGDECKAHCRLRSALRRCRGTSLGVLQQHLASVLYRPQRTMLATGSAAELIRSWSELVSHTLLAHATHVCLISSTPIRAPARGSAPVASCLPAMCSTPPGAFDTWCISPLYRRHTRTRVITNALARFPSCVSVSPLLVPLINPWNRLRFGICDFTNFQTSHPIYLYLIAFSGLICFIAFLPHLSKMH